LHRDPSTPHPPGSAKGQTSMPLIGIIILAIIAVGLVVAVVAPIIAGDPIQPTPEAPTEISAPAEPGIDDSSENLETEISGNVHMSSEYLEETGINGGGVRSISELGGSTTESESRTEDGATVGGAIGSLPDF
jgi:hypothetical protein